MYKFTRSIFRSWRIGPVVAFIGVLLGVGCASQVHAANTFTNPEECRKCHSRQYQEWVGSSHAYASVSPTFNALEVIGNQFTEGHFSADSGHASRELFCQGCHTPVAVELDEQLSNSNLLANFSLDRRPVVEQLEALPDTTPNVATALRGNSCDVCHQAVGPKHTAQAFFYDAAEGFGGIANASFIFAPNNSKTEAGKDRYGPFADAAGAIHGTCQAKAYSEFSDASPSGDCVETGVETGTGKGGYFTSGEFCGSCHDVRPGNPLAGMNNDSTITSSNPDGDSFLRLENLFTEWRGSAWNTNSIPHFNAEKLSNGLGTLPVTCQDCHMSTFPYGAKIGTQPLAKLYPIDVLEDSRLSEQTVSTHYFTGVDVSLLDPEKFATKHTTHDTQNTLARKAYKTRRVNAGDGESATTQVFMPVGQNQRRKDLLQAAARIDVEYDARFIDEGILNFDVTVENIGAGHNIPSGFSQERQFWIALEVTDANGQDVWKTGYLSGELQELQRLTQVSLEPTSLEVDAASLARAGFTTVNAEDLTYDNFEDEIRGHGPKYRTLSDYQNNIIANDQIGGGPDQHLKFFGNEFKRRSGAANKGVEVFSPFIANEMDNSHSLAPFVPYTFHYVATGIKAKSLTYPLSISATLNYRAFPPRFLQGLLDSMKSPASGDNADKHPSLLPKELLARNKVIEMARKDFTITGNETNYQTFISSNGRCFDIKESHYDKNTSPGTVLLWDCHQGDNQQFIFKTNGLIESSNGMCLSVANSDWKALDVITSDAALSSMRVNVEECTNSGAAPSARQVWSSTTDGRLKVKKGSLEWCLQRTSYAVSGVGELTLSSCWDPIRESGDGSRYTQQWFYKPSFRPIVSGVDAAGISKCLEVDPDNLYASNADIEINSCNGSANQQWQLTQKGLLLNANGRCLDISASDWNSSDLIEGNANNRNSRLVLWSCLEIDSPDQMLANQQWKFEAGGLRTQVNASGHYFCLGATDTNLADGSKATLRNCDTYQANLTEGDEFRSLEWSFSAPFTSWPTGQIMNKNSGHCIHPAGGTAIEGGKAVLWRNCTQQDNITFEYMGSKHFKELLNGLCLDVENAVKGEDVVFSAECTDTPFVITPRGQLQLDGSDLCVTPEAEIPGDGTVLGLDYCSSSPNQQFVSVPLIAKIIVQESSGMCWHTADGSSGQAQGSKLILSSSCVNDEAALFTHLDSGLIKHLPSGYCIHPAGGTGNVGDNLILWDDCRFHERLAYEVVDFNSLQHQESGLCVNPKSGLANPTEGAEVILSAACSSSTADEKSQFNFQ